MVTVFPSGCSETTSLYIVIDCQTNYWHCGQSQQSQGVTRVTFTQVPAQATLAGRRWVVLESEEHGHSTSSLLDASFLLKLNGQIDRQG